MPSPPQEPFAEEAPKSSQFSREYYGSKRFVLEELRRHQQEDPGTSKAKRSISQQSADAVAHASALSAGDAWMAGSSMLSLRNPFCVGNAPAAMQLEFWRSVAAWTALYSLVVGVATLAWSHVWLNLSSSGMVKAMMPCLCSFCYGATEADPSVWGTVQRCGVQSEQGFGCSSRAMLSTCVPDSCVNDLDELESCWTAVAFILVVCVAYMIMLHRRNHSGRDMLMLICVIEGILAGAGTLTWNSTVFLEFFTYNFGMVALTALGLHIRLRRWSASFEGLGAAEGHMGESIPPAQQAVSRVVGQTLMTSFFAVMLLAILWEIGAPKVTVGTNLAFISALAFTAGAGMWLLFEGSRLQKKYCPDEALHLVISFHVDFFCIVMLAFVWIFVNIILVVKAVPGMAMTMLGLANSSSTQVAVAADKGPSQQQSLKRKSRMAAQGRTPLLEDTEDAVPHTGGQRTAFKETMTWAEYIEKKLGNLAGILLITVLAVAAFFSAESTAFFATCILISIPVSRALMERHTGGQEASKHLVQEVWVDEDDVEFHIEALNGNMMQVSREGSWSDDGRRLMFAESSDKIWLKAFHRPSHPGMIEWTHGEHRKITAIQWACGKRWFPLLDEVTTSETSVATTAAASTSEAF